jgi:hypothetical protein
MAVTFELIDNTGTVIHQHQEYCREVLAGDLHSDIGEHGTKGLQLRCFAFDHEDNEGDYEYEEDEDGNEIEVYIDPEESWASDYDSAQYDWTDKNREYFNNLMKDILKGHSIFVEMKEDKWVYFSEIPSTPFFSLVLYIIRHGVPMFQSDRWKNSKDRGTDTVIKCLLDRYFDIGLMDTLNTLFYLGTMKTKRTLTRREFAEFVIGPSSYIDLRLREREDTREAFKDFLLAFKEEVIAKYKMSYGDHKFRRFPGEKTMTSQNILWEVLPDECKTGETGKNVTWN